MARVALPRVSEALEEREFRINESLRKAERLRLQAEDAIAAYERMMADVRAKAAGGGPFGARARRRRNRPNATPS